MSRPNRRLIVLGVVLVLVLAEVALNALHAPMARVQVVNEGITPIEDLRLTFGGAEALAPPIQPGESVHLSFSGWKRRPLTVKFRQEGNPMTGFELPEFDPSYLSEGRAKLVITVKPGAFERGQEEDAATTPRGRVLGAVGRWLDQALKAP